MSGKIYILEENQDLHHLMGKSNESTDLKVSGESFSSESFDVGLIIDKAAYSVYVKGEKVSFPKKEFELLLLLASNPRKVFKRDDILRQIWGANYKQKDSRSLDVHIRMLRKKLYDTFITTIRGVGYKLEK